MSVSSSTPVSFAQCLTDCAQRTPEQIALIDRNQPTTYRELNAQVEKLAAGFAKLGIGAGDRIALWLPNCLAWVQTFLACARLGATVLAVNTRFRSKEVADIVGRGQAKWLVMWPEFKGIPFADILSDVPSEITQGLEGIITLGQSPERLAGHQPIRFEDLLHSTDAIPADYGNNGVLCYTTSGTTSLPKFVLHDQKTLIMHARAMIQAYGYDHTSRILASTPFCGAFGFSTLSGGLANGFTIVSEPVSDTASTLEQIRLHGVTHTYANNESILKLLESAPTPELFKTCKLFGFASFSPALGELLTKAEQAHLPLTGLYGSSELQALIAAQPTDSNQGDTSVRYVAGGRLIHPEARLRARDPASGHVLPHGESGEIEIKTPSIMLGYLDNPDATRQAFTDDGYFKTGDLGYAVSDTQFVFQTRLGDSMRLSGFMVNPVEIEQCIEEQPGVLACQVVAGTKGSKVAPVAFVILRDGARVDTATWTQACKRVLAGFKVPVHFEIVTEFPSVQSANAVKIQKNKLREMADQILGSMS